jgi:putative membrane protein
MTLPPFHLHPEVWALFGGIELLYLDAWRRRQRDHPAEAGTWWRPITFFSLGVFVLWLGAMWPIHDLAERYLYSVHMVQHLLFSLVAPPLLLAGMPDWMLRRPLRPRPVQVVVRFVTRPLVALILFNAVLLFTHWPAIVDLSVRSEWDHFLLHALLVSSALAMWWPVMSPLPELPPLSPPGQMLYLFLQSLAPTIPASFLTLGSGLLYPVYATFPRIWGITAHSDQLVAGLIMKLAGGAILWGFIATIFFRWHAKEEQTGWDPLQLRQVEREVTSELSKR